MEHYTRDEWARIAQLMHGDRLDGRPRQDIYAQSQYQNYEIGARLKEPGRLGRTLHYCRAGAAITLPFWGHINGNRYHADGFEGNTAAVAYAVGTKTIVILDTGAAADRPVDYYRGGWIVLFVAGGVVQMCGIDHSTVGNSTSITLTLANPLTTLTPASTFVTVHPSIYRNVRPGMSVNSGFETFVCIPLIEVTSEYFFWGQTYGPCYAIPHGTPPGANANERDMYFHIDGSIDLAENFAIGATNSHQRAGYILSLTGYPPDDKDTFFMLQLAP